MNGLVKLLCSFPVLLLWLLYSVQQGTTMIKSFKYIIKNLTKLNAHWICYKPTKASYGGSGGGGRDRQTSRRTGGQADRRTGEQANRRTGSQCKVSVITITLWCRAARQWKVITILFAFVTRQKKKTTASEQPAGGATVEVSPARSKILLLMLFCHALTCIAYRVERLLLLLGKT